MEDNNTVNDENSTVYNNVTQVDTSLYTMEISIWIVIIFYGIICLSVVLNLHVIIGIVRKKRNSTCSLALQMSVNDLITSWVAGIEIWALRKHSWTLGPKQCSIFLGMEILVNTVSIYLLVLLNFHSLSTWNIKMHNEDSNNPLTTGLNSSNDCLMSQSQNSLPSRGLRNEYKKGKASVSIVIPSILIWFVCLSLGIPEFFLSSVVDYSFTQICSIVDLHYVQWLQLLLVTFRGIVPTCLLLMTFLTVLQKIFNNESLSIVKKNSSSKKFKELINILRLGLILNILYMIFSFQRVVFYILHVFNEYNDYTNIKNLKVFPLECFIFPDYIFIYSSLFHYLSLVFRPVVCICVLPFSVNYLRRIVCKKNKE